MHAMMMRMHGTPRVGRAADILTLGNCAFRGQEDPSLAAGVVTLTNYSQKKCVLNM
jgi:hypothetical protein